MLRSILVHINTYLAVSLSQKRCTLFFGNINIIEFWLLYPDYNDLLNFASNCTTRSITLSFPDSDYSPVREINVRPAGMQYTD